MASSTKVVRRNRTRKQRQESSPQTSTIEYDLTDDPEHGQTGRTRRPARRQGKPAPLPSSSSRGTLGPSGLPMLRTSERGTFKRCRFLYEMEYMRLRKPVVSTPPLQFGSLIHIALAGFYKKGIRRGPHPAGLFEQAFDAEVARVAKATKTKQHHLREEWANRLEMGVSMMNNYIETYGKDDEWKVLATELPFRVIVHHPTQGGGGVVPWFWYTGILDLLVESRRTGRKRIRDHKTTVAISTKYLALDDQVTSYYTWGVMALRNAGALGPTEQIEGMDINFLRKAKVDDRPFRVELDESGTPRKYYLNQDESISKRQPAPYFLRHFIPRHNFEKEHQQRRVLAEFRDMEAVRKDPTLLYKNPGKFTCPGCWAFDICELHEVGADYESVIAETTRPWDPYEAHEIYAGETR